ncbi:DnaD domain protein [Aneurinibacillus sp. Ricciae_BoGa-3]|uniref:replication initiation and membrane attachment family protein n=1 Tax=Aneurinibacillus sp. Ricciae_BoGa-3 TaxID=3022697 RepID=UPI0023414CA2|nr:DnaD domain protein [Aneurinibacillus sp. Ricciae_BoGa-3]WCK55528.1 DnaD domain protein [Aneurinibacillus sp. Ricciae_BoGa-3]
MRWGQTVPNDRFIIRVNRPISSAEIGYLIHLYQPLLGVIPVSLYQTLYHNVSLSGFASIEGLHRSLMVTLAEPLDIILKARYKLEAMGLIDTYRIQAAGEPILEYTLRPPYGPDVFFSDDTLSIMLLNRVGKQHYRNLRRKFTSAIEKLPEDADREKITKGFDEVFFHVHPREITPEPGVETMEFLQDVRHDGELDAFNEDTEADRIYLKTEVDFELLEALLPKSLKSEKLLTGEVCETLQQLAFLYQLNDLQLANFLQDPGIYRDDNQIDTAILRRVAREWFRGMNGGKAPQIKSTDADKESPKEGQAARKRKPALTREEEHRRMLSSLSPLQLLAHYHNGGRIAPSDQKIVEELLEDYQLPYGVVNVLLEYIMLTQERQMPKALIFKIAGHWKRSNIRTVEEAQKLARQLYSEYKGNAKPDARTDKPAASSNKTWQPRSQAKRKDELPPLIKAQLARQKDLDKNGGTFTVDETADEDYEQTKQRITELLKSMGETN